MRQQQMFGTSFKKALVHGAVASGSTIWLLGTSAGIMINCWGMMSEPMSVPFWAFGLGAGISASYLADLIHFNVKEEVPLHQKIEDTSSLIIGSCMTSGILAAQFYLANPDLIKEFGMVNIIMIGVVSEITSAYLINMF